MTAETANPIDIVTTCLKLLMKKDYNAGLRYIAPGCEYDNGPLGVVHGPEGARALLEPFFAPTLENEFIVRRSAVAGPVVFLERVDRHRLADKWVELPVTGVWEVHDGLITIWHDYFDVGTIMSQWPQPAAA